MPTRVHRTSPSPLDPATVEGWAGVPTTIAADLLQGRTLVDPAIRPLRPFAGGKRLAGPAVTARCEHADYGPVHHAIAAHGLRPVVDRVFPLEAAAEAFALMERGGHFGKIVVSLAT